jgi:hypothetical protein
MEWLLSLAIVPLLLCGLMCAVPMVLAAVGLRRRAILRACHDHPDHGAAADREGAAREREAATR